MPHKEETGTQKAMNDYIKKIEKIRREQSEEDYHQLRSLFRIKMETMYNTPYLPIISFLAS